MADYQSKSWLSRRTKRFWAFLCAVLLILAIALGVGLGVGLTRGNGSSSGEGSPPSTGPQPPITNNTNATTGSFWRPPAGASWQIVLEYALNDTSEDVSVYDIDLFDNTDSTIRNLHSLNRSVICYFSAGSYEDFRPDSDKFQPSDKGKELDGWPGEYWLDTNSSNVRNIMKDRLALASQKGCDGVDPDNVDGYDNDNGLGLTATDAVNYLTFLATEAHRLNMSIGLKNAAEVIDDTLDMMQWEVNEQCVQYNECDLFRPFIDAGKPVFHIEYPSSAPRISSSTKNQFCDDSAAAGFSSILKNMDLDNWVDPC
ncbi:putative endo alpha-1,4-polygalactosaminidase [Xylogone sp. PMI_703]|nr:putative endo alpha-1,4-polygalactosaminidase [Xylogone sp. PMI_703]